MDAHAKGSASELAQGLVDARARTLALISDLADEQLMGPRLPIVNPLLWEIGHVAWFQEKWVLRHRGKAGPIREDADALYDSIAIAHDTRWDLPLPSREETLAYMQKVMNRIIERLGSIDLDREESYFHYLALFHEDMHDEAFTYTRQILGYPRPRLTLFPDGDLTGQTGGGPLAGDAETRVSQEKWVLRHRGKAGPIREDADALYDSIAIAHDTRWDLPLPSREETLAYMQKVMNRIIERLGSIDLDREESYFHYLALFHEDMHDEAFTYTRQILGYPRPRLTLFPDGDLTGQTGGGPLAGDAEIPGGIFLLGATPDLLFVFDNEKWAHPVTLQPFRIAHAAVTNGEFVAFVDDKGYLRQEFWSEEGWRWRQNARAEHPVYWHRDAGGRWSRRRYDEIVPLEEHHPIIHRDPIADDRAGESTLGGFPGVTFGFHL